VSLNLSIAPTESVPYTLRYQDEDLLVVDKPARIATQPGKGHEHDTLLNGLFAAFGPQLQNLGRARDFGLLHRLDRQTSGLLIVGLKPKAYDGLRAQFEKRAIKKFYWAVASRAPKKPSGVIRRPILEETDDKKLARISSAGKPSVTAYRVLQVSTKPGQHAALVECRPVTGRLHQVRVHLESIGCPILGDDLYAPRPIAMAAARLALHAHRLVFKHPTTGATIDVRSPWPKDLANALRRVGLTKPESVQGTHEISSDGVGDEEA
jgi:23S rRNA pseudouridine1911/1915/1917 synthase